MSRDLPDIVRRRPMRKWGVGIFALSNVGWRAPNRAPAAHSSRSCAKTGLEDAICHAAGLRCDTAGTWVFLPHTMVPVLRSAFPVSLVGVSRPAFAPNAAPRS